MSNMDKSKAAPVSSAATSVVSTPAKPPSANGSPVSAGNEPPKPPPLPVSSVGTAPDEGDEKDKIQYFVIVGKVETFPDVSKAEKFLNSPDAPECTVIYGKVSLINEWHITTGTIHPFNSLAKAQKFLKDPAAPKAFVMVRGRITVPEVRVSLRG
jgi:hypothetical protein